MWEYTGTLWDGEFALRGGRNGEFTKKCKHLYQYPVVWMIFTIFDYRADPPCNWCKTHARMHKKGVSRAWDAVTSLATIGELRST